MTSPSPEPRFFQRTDVLCFLAAWILLTARLLYQVTYFPAYFAGEECRVLDVCGVMHGTAVYRGSWWQSFVACVPEYNKGYAWFALPFVEWFGYDLRILFVMVPVFVGLWGAYLFFTYRKSSGAPPAALWSFLLVACFALLAISIRRYKWHTMCYPGAISVYLYFVPDLVRNLRTRTAFLIRLSAILIFCVASFFYFGNIIFTVPFFVLLLFVAILDRRRSAIVFCVVFALSVVALQVIAYKTSPLWAYDIDVSVERIRGFFSAEQLALRWETVRFFFSNYLSGPFTVLLATGFGISLVRAFRGDKFSVINVVFLSWLLGMQFLMWGINNVDCLNWSMIPMLSVLLVGAETIRNSLTSRLRHGNAVFAVLALLASGYELHFYPTANRNTHQQGTIDPYNTTSQAALAFRLVSENNETGVAFFMPAESLTVESGGFLYEMTAKRADLNSTYARITFFTSEQDLDAKLHALPSGTEARVFLNVWKAIDPGDPNDLFQQPLLGQKPVPLYPYNDIYRSPFCLRLYRFPVRK